VTTGTSTLEIVPDGPFSLAEASRFGFGPQEADGDGVLRLAFAQDHSEAATGAALRQTADGTVVATVSGGSDEDGVRRQLARILSLDHDTAPWIEVGRRDPVIGALQTRFAGLRPVLFHSPYEAAAWCVVSARIGRRGGQAIWTRISERWGEAFALDGETRCSFPGPRTLAAHASDLPGLPEEKRRRLHGIAVAAADGALDAEHLRALGPDAAGEAVQTLRGIGPFAATLIVVRAVGWTDVLAANEPLVQKAVAHFYGSDAPADAAAITERAETWRPFRTWATVLLRVAADRDGVTGHAR
jgi:DNA-3-methyladenine glycosylase II